MQCHPAQTTPANPLARLRRPRILIRAARFGLAEYDRQRGLRRIFPDGAAAVRANPVRPLLARELACERQRKAGDAAYSAAQHVEILIALMAEAHLEQAAAPAP